MAPNIIQIRMPPDTSVCLKVKGHLICMVLKRDQQFVYRLKPTAALWRWYKHAPRHVSRAHVKVSALPLQLHDFAVDVRATSEAF